MKCFIQSIRNITLSCLYGFIATTLTADLRAGDFYTLDTTFEDGRYTYSFTDGSLPLAFGAYPNSKDGGIFINSPDATEVTVTEYWSVTFTTHGFDLSYTGPLSVFPIGYLPIEVSFTSSLLPTDVVEENPFSGPLSGLVTGTLFVENTLKASTSPIVGYHSFGYNAEAPSIGEINEAVLKANGFELVDLAPVATDISVRGNRISIALLNIVSEINYYVEFRSSLSADNWVRIYDFTAEDLDEYNMVHLTKEGLSGYFRVVMPIE